MLSYEEIARLLEGLEPPPRPDELHVEWLDASRMGVGVDSLGRYALLIVGAPLAPKIDIVAQAVRDGEWRTPTGSTLKGSVLQLPQGDAFRTATSTIAAELFRCGLETRPCQEAFAEVEPFVALVLRRMLLPEEYVLGLIGELLILRELLQTACGRVPPATDPTACWRGWQRQARDFVLPRASIEVKTTGLSVSRHRISGLDQVEPRAIDGDQLERLFIASVGLRRSSGGIGHSIAGLADDIILALRRDSTDPNQAEAKFLDRLRQYGPEGFEGYRHPEMREQQFFAQCYTTIFSPRAYDMGDVNIRVLRRSDLASQFQCVVPENIEYTIDLPDSVPGSPDNPCADIEVLLRTALELAT
jgi:hypothetical protein